MIEEQRLEQKLNELHEQWRELCESIAKYKHHRIQETRFEEKDRLSAIIAEKEIELKNIEEELSPLETQYNHLKAQTLIQTANRMERNNAFAEAIEVWQEIRTLNPTNLDIDAEIQRLSDRLQITHGIGVCIKQLTRRISEIGPTIFKEVVEGLKRPDGSILYPVVDSFLKGELSAADFLLVWTALSSEPNSRKTEEPNYQALSERLKRGDIVLFLGPDISCLYNTPRYDAVVTTLARQANYPGFSGSLATLGEYYHIQNDYGRRSLVNNLRGILYSSTPQIPLYLKLAHIDQPLVLISTAYDTFIEDAFQNNNKKYVLISATLDSSMAQEIGSIHIQYSDGKPPKTFSPKEELSGLNLLEEGYSLIYEVRGFIDSKEKPANQGCNNGDLALSENNYFNFARYVDKLIPDYLIRQFAGRGLFFLGYACQQWEDRLIIDAILDKRHQHRQYEPPCTISSPNDDSFSKAYWRSRGVRRYEMELQDFLNRLEYCL